MLNRLSLLIYHAISGLKEQEYNLLQTHCTQTFAVHAIIFLQIR